MHGQRVDTDVAATVEASSLADGPLTVLLAVQGDLATPSLESVKTAFARVTTVTDDTAKKLTAAAPPHPYASGVAVVLLLGDRAHVATSGRARCFRERAGLLEQLASGAHPTQSGDTYLAASHPDLREGHGFFTAPIEPTHDAEFRNDTLDAALASALAPYPALIAVAAARIH